MLDRFLPLALLSAASLMLPPEAALSQQNDPESQQTITSERIAFGDGELILKQSVIVDVGIEEAWTFFTDPEQIRLWMAPVAEVDIRPGGAIRTHYDACASVGERGTIELEVVNFIPRQLLTLQSSLESAREASWMTDAIFERQNDLYNIIQFEEISPDRTRIISWGLGYRQDPEWQAMLGFFIAGNEWSFTKLQDAIRGQQVWPPCDK